MASSLALKVGTFTSTITFAKTDSEVAQVLQWFIADWAETEPTGLTQAQLNQWRLDRAAEKIQVLVRQDAARIRKKILQQAQASLEDQATSDTAI